MKSLPDAGMVGNATADTGAAAVTPTASATRTGGRPSLWSALWALAALIYLAFARAIFARLG